MLDRLFAAIVSGPSLNCRPHHSRQRIDLAAFERFRDTSPAVGLRSILGEAAAAEFVARVTSAPVRVLGRPFQKERVVGGVGTGETPVPRAELSPEESATRAVPGSISNRSSPSCASSWTTRGPTRETQAQALAGEGAS